MIGLLIGVIGVGTFVVKVFALIDAARQRGDAYVATGKRTKGFWAGILAAAVGLQLLTGIDNPIGFFGINLLGLVAAIVYLVDVRPAIREITGQGGTGRIDRGSW
jgi:Protein of unknown function (DUF2516)